MAISVFSNIPSCSFVHIVAFLKMIFSALGIILNPCALLGNQTEGIKLSIVKVKVFLVSLKRESLCSLKV